ncbi:MAG TPA: 2-oxo-4-hydroxy-4-carboxy-5-ureidoimidazoline decarboxylase [Propionibacteriaceae bacterium]
MNRPDIRAEPVDARATSSGAAAAASSGPLPLEEFNQLSPEAAERLLRPCLDIDRWVRVLIEDRPYARVADVIETARRAAEPFTDEEVEAALAHHPRIGERATGGSAEAALSRSEQSGVVADEDVQRQISEGNQAYEQRFGRVFLIQAAGRSAEEILASLESRLGNNEEIERSIVADQLREIALLRLAGVVAP